MPGKDIILNAIWVPGESTYTVEFYFENANDDNYTWDKALNETRIATTGSTATVTQADIDLANEQIAIANGTYESFQQDKFYGFDYSHCEDATVSDDGSGVLRLYYDREMWDIYLMDNLVGTHAYDRNYLTGLEEFNSWEKVIWKEFSGKYGSSVPANFPTNDELMARAMELKETADEKYQRSDLVYAGHTQVYTNADGHGGTFDDDDELRHASWYSFGSFGVEDKDKPGSRAVHVYPALSEGSYNYYITWKGEKLGVHGVEPDDFETVHQDIAGPSSSPIGPGFIAGKIEGFTYVGGAMQSFCESDKCSITKTVYAVPTTGFLGDFHGVGCTHTNVLKVEDQDSWGPVLQACWLDTDAHLDLSTGATKRLKVGQYTTYFMRREKYDVNFVSQIGDEETVLRTVEGVYYEQPLDSVPMADGTTEDLLAYVPDSAPAGMKFAGWYSSSDFDSANAVVEGSTMPAGALTLYAKWEPLDATVTFDTRGGTEVASQTVQVGGKATLPAEPTREGYEFTGWYTAADGGERWGFDRQVTGDTTLYAHWRRANSGTVTVRHVMEGESEPFATEAIQGIRGVTVMAEALAPQDLGYPANSYLKPDYAERSVEITGDPDADVVTFTYVPAAQRTYTVEYRDRATGSEIAQSAQVTTLNSYVTEVAANVDGYTAEDAWIAQAIKDGDTIVFWYNAGEDEPGTPEPDPDTPEPDAPEPDKPEPDTPDTPEPDKPEPDSDKPEPDAPDTPVTPDPDAPEANTPDSPAPAPTPEKGEQPKPAGEEAPAPKKDDPVLPETGDASFSAAPALLAGCASVAAAAAVVCRRRS